jgi:hypothetical protein
MNDITVNNSNNDGESLVGGELDCTRYSKETYFLAWTMLCTLDDGWGDV